MDRNGDACGTARRLAGIWRPVDLAIDPAGSLAVSELGQSHRIRLIEASP